jgi:DNA end-binding protein Ku
MMRFADELADLDDFRFPKKGEIRPAELNMARQLIASLESTWDPSKYTDEYKENLMRVIRAKTKGTSPKLIVEDHGPKQAEVVDLMARLRASLEGRKGAGTSRAAAKGSAKKHAASKGRKTVRKPRRVA